MKIVVNRVAMARHGLILSQDGDMPYTHILEAYLDLFGAILI